MWYNLNAQNLVIQLIPVFLRKSRLISLLALGASEIVNINNLLIRHRAISIAKVTHNSQVCKLRKILNDTFDHERRIKIIEGVLKKPSYIYTKAEQKPKWLGKLIIYTVAETQGVGNDFTVVIPNELKNYQIEIRALVNFYKLAGKRFNIIVDEKI